MTSSNNSFKSCGAPETTCDFGPFVSDTSMAALGGSCSALFVFSTIALSVPVKTKKHVLASPFNKRIKKKIRDIV